MEMRKVFCMNGDGVVTLKMVYECGRYFDLIEEEEYTEEELRKEDIYTSEEEAWEAYEEHKASIIFDEE